MKPYNMQNLMASMTTAMSADMKEKSLLMIRVNGTALTAETKSRKR